MNSLISENFELHAKKIPGLCQGMDVFEERNHVAVDSGLACDTFNIIYINTPKIELSELESSLKRYRSKNFPYCIWVNEENLSNETSTLFKELDIERQAEEIGMVLDLENYDPISTPNHFHIQRVSNQDLLNKYARVIAENWTPADQNVIDYYQRTSEHYLDTDNGIQLFIYYHEGKPVSCVELFPTDNQTIGFYGFATLEAYRGLGIGTTLMTYTLNISKQSGYKTAVLQGTKDGLGIYKKYGFQPVNTYYEYA